MDFSQTPHPSLTAHVQNWCKFGCNRVKTKGTLLEEQRTFSAVSRLLLQWSTSNYTPITSCACATKYKFGCDRSIIKGTLLEEQRNIFLCITTSITVIYLKLHTYYILRMIHKQYKFRCDRSIIKGTLLEQQRILSAVSRLILQWSTPKYKPVISAHGPQTI